MAFIYVIVSMFSRIGDIKSQQVSINKYNDLSYYIGDDVGGIQSLFPLHFFTLFNKNEVLDRMGCLVSNTTALCNKFEERKCEVWGLTQPEYDTCMLVQYEKAGMDLKSFCKNHYDPKNGLWTKKETTSSSFYVAKHTCLLNAGVKRGKEYCDDQNIVNTQYTSKELYKCYKDTKVLNSTYADEKCNLASPKISPDATVREAYKTCMAAMKVPVSANDLCLIDNYW
jgi:hypothetical protein